MTTWSTIAAALRMQFRSFQPVFPGITGIILMGQDLEGYCDLLRPARHREIHGERTSQFGVVEAVHTELDLKTQSEIEMADAQVTCINKLPRDNTHEE